MTNDATHPPDSRAHARLEGADTGCDGAVAAGEPAIFSRTLVHDLRNAVAPVRNAVQLLRLRGNGDADLGKVTDIIDRQVNEIVRLLNVAADYAAHGAGTSPAANTRTSTPATASATICRDILIVDDNAAFLTSLRSVLVESGHNVKTAVDGIEALAVAQSWKPEFVLLDMHMPRMNGYEVARQLRTMFPGHAMKLVLVSGTTLDATTLRGAERAGFDHCIDKINGVAELETLLRGDA
ncbi:MAG: response regulator [Burkholderiales bacterium]